MFCQRQCVWLAKFTHELIEKVFTDYILIILLSRKRLVISYLL